jgi:endonuclease I
LKKLVILFYVFLSLPALAGDYYAGIRRESGYQLKTALKKLISSGHRDRGYDALIEVYMTSDRDTTYDGDNSIVDMYSENPNQDDPYNYSEKKQTCGEYRGEANCFNREHVFPQSAFNRAYPMRSDFFHIYPTDGYVNNRRGHLSFGEVKEVQWESKNGSKVGRNAFENEGNVVFEPIDEFKGDIARSLLYFATRYEDQIENFKHEWLDGSKTQVYRSCFVRLLLKWHAQDPVSDHERQRNEAGFAYQGNRNPYIDHPEWVGMIWDKTAQP